MTFSQFLSILRARWLMVLSVFLTVVVVVVGFSLWSPKQYSAVSDVVIDMKSSDPIAGAMALSSMAAGSYMATQVDIARSDRVAVRVVRELRLADKREFREMWLQESSGRGDFETWLARLVQRKLDVTPSRESTMFSIKYTAPDAALAAQMANGFVKAYMDTALELRTDPARRYSAFFEDQAKALREKLESAQTKLAEYQRSNNILATDERVDMEMQRLSELSTQLVQIQAISAESRARSASARSNQDVLQDVINNPVVANLRADVTREEAKLQEMQARLGEAHPAIEQQKAVISALNRRIASEARRAGSSVGVTSSINTGREAQVRAALEAQRAKVLRMREQRGEMNVLLKEVESAQRAYEQIQQRQTQTALEGQSNQTNIAVLTPASVPSEPSSPNVPRNALIAGFVGLLLGVAVAFVRELMDRRVRSTADVSELLGLPVIGVIPGPTRSLMGGNQDRLVLPANVLSRLPGPSGQ